VYIRHSIKHALEDEAQIPLESLLISVRISMHRSLENEAQIPLEPLLISISNSPENALVEDSFRILIDFN
jgi:hypothetical protein